MPRTTDENGSDAPARASRPKLTVRTCAAIRKRAEAELEPGSKSTIKVRDGSLDSLTYRVRRSADGEVRGTFYLRRWQDGREYWDLVTDGSNRAVTAPDAARRRAKQMLATAPATAREAERVAKAEGETVAELVRRFIADRETRKRSPRTVEEYRKLVDGSKRDANDERVLGKGMLAPLGSIGATKLTEAEVVAFHSKNSERPIAANRCVALLGAAFEWARLPKNPARLARGWKYPERARALGLSDGELSKIGKAITELLAEKEITPQAAGLFRALAATGCRPVELLSLTWDRVDRRHGVLRLAPTKTKSKDPRARHGVPISPPVAEILTALPKVNGNPYVFAGARGGRLLDYAKVWKIIVQRAGIETGDPEHDRDLVPYILRHSAASLGALAMPLPVLQQVMGHRSIATTSRYVHIDRDPASRGAATIAATVAAKLDGKKAVAR
jgi:integrase